MSCVFLKSQTLTRIVWNETLFIYYEIKYLLNSFETRFANSTDISSQQFGPRISERITSRINQVSVMEIFQEGIQETELTPNLNFSILFRGYYLH